MRYAKQEQEILNEIAEIKEILLKNSGNQKNVEDKLKELIRKNDRLCNSLKSNELIKRNEAEVCESVRKMMPYITVNPVGKGGINYTFLINSKDRIMSEKMWGGIQRNSVRKRTQYVHGIVKTILWHVA